MKQRNKQMKIIESIIVGKKNHDSCEDCLVITDGFVAVIDGSTSKTPFQISNKMKNGRFAALLISEYIERELPDNATIDVFCTGVTKKISDQYKSLNLQYRLTLHPEERLTASGKHSVEGRKTIRCGSVPLVKWKVRWAKRWARYTYQSSSQHHQKRE